MLTDHAPIMGSESLPTVHYEQVSRVPGDTLGVTFQGIDSMENVSKSYVVFFHFFSFFLFHVRDVF